MNNRIAIFGAGSIGCYVGGALAASDASAEPIILIGRPRLINEIKTNGLKLTDYLGHQIHVAPVRVVLETNPDAAKHADLILVCVKSAATPVAADELSRVARPGTLVISLQNGISNAEYLAKKLPQCTVLAGMVPFNVAHAGPGHWHRGTEGELHVEANGQLKPYLDRFTKALLPLLQRTDIESVQWGKLLVNLNNAVNALSGLPLLAQLSDWNYRYVVASSIREARALLKGAGIKPARIGKVPPALLPVLLMLPNALYLRLAQKMLRIDPKARSSMAEDLAAGRLTEINYLNGEIVRLAARVGRPAPVNARIIDLVHDAERGGRRTWEGRELRKAIKER